MYALRPYQAEAKKAILAAWDEGQRKTLLVLPTGCHAKGQCLLTAGGTSLPVEEIQVGTRLLGSDGTVRTVLATHHGIGDLYQVIPIKGEPFIVTGDHKLTLIRTNERLHPMYPCEKHGGEIVDVPVSEWLRWSNNMKHLHKLSRCAGVDKFPDHKDEQLSLDPYFLGILLGDGGLSTGAIQITTPDSEIRDAIFSNARKYDMGIRTQSAGQATTYILTKSWKANGLRKAIKALDLFGHKAGDKFVPKCYLTAEKTIRAEVLAGLIDTDGCLSKSGYDYVTKSQRLALDVVFLCRSLGLAAYCKPCKKKYGTFTGKYFRIFISGDCTSIPCRVARRKAPKRSQKKSVLRTGFNIKYYGKGEYFGFTVDGDNRYLLDDFTVTHNCGKTIVFASVTENQVNRGHRVLIMAHRGELLDQAADKLKNASGLDSVLEKAESTSLGSPIPVTVGSVQSLAQEKRLARFPTDYFQDIIVDEAHHCLSNSYKRVLDHFPEANVLGVTATPDRGDMRDLGEYFDSKAYEYSITQAVRDGYLCPIKAQMIPLKLNIADVGISSGDFSAGEIGHALEPYLHQIAQEMTHYCQGRKTVVFLPLIATSQKFCAMLNNAGFRAAEVNGNSLDRAEILSDFERGKYDVLCNSMLLTEGWDCPAVDCIVVLRPTKIRALFQQMVGRGMRLSPGKTDLLLLDFLWLTERHDLCRPSSLISKDADIAKKIDERMMEDTEGFDLIEAEEQAERDILAEREEALARELAEMRQRQRKLVDPLQYALSIAAEDLANYVPTFAWEMGPPSEKQIAFLEHRGIFAASVPNSGMASLLIDRLKRRQDEGLATPKQIRCLERYGFRQVGTWQFDDASHLISRLASNNWRIPRGLDPTQYKP